MFNKEKRFRNKIIIIIIITGGVLWWGCQKHDIQKSYCLVWCFLVIVSVLSFPFHRFKRYTERERAWVCERKSICVIKMPLSTLCGKCYVVCYKKKIVLPLFVDSVCCFWATVQLTTDSSLPLWLCWWSTPCLCVGRFIPLLGAGRFISCLCADRFMSCLSLAQLSVYCQFHGCHIVWKVLSFHIPLRSAIITAFCNYWQACVSGWYLTALAIIITLQKLCSSVQLGQKKVKSGCFFFSRGLLPMVLSSLWYFCKVLFSIMCHSSWTEDHKGVLWVVKIIATSVFWTSGFWFRSGFLFSAVFLVLSYLSVAPLSFRFSPSLPRKRCQSVVWYCWELFSMQVHAGSTFLNFRIFIW